ncbi:MAG: hypothetical protein AB8F78_07565 [Saprospiraceae bacterium]
MPNLLGTTSGRLILEFVVANCAVSFPRIDTRIAENHSLEHKLLLAKTKNMSFIDQMISSGTSNWFNIHQSHSNQWMKSVSGSEYLMEGALRPTN